MNATGSYGNVKFFKEQQTFILLIFLIIYSSK